MNVPYVLCDFRLLVQFNNRILTKIAIKYLDTLLMSLHSGQKFKEHWIE